MVSRIVLILTIFLSITAVGLAQDPGAPDSVIIESGEIVPYTPGQWTTHAVHIYFVTDDSIVFYNLPLTWTSVDDQIRVAFVEYKGVFLQWDDLYDSIYTNEHIAEMAGWSDIGGADNPSLYTYGLRENLIDLHFLISPEALPQLVSIDTTHVAMIGGLQFGGYAGYFEFVPRFVASHFFYGSPLGIKDKSSNPSDFSLSQNYPNPFNPQTKIDFALPKGSFVSLEIYNILGQKVKTLVGESKPAGYYSIIWDGKNSYGLDVPSGVYFYKLIAGDFLQTKKMVMMR